MRQQKTELKGRTIVDYNGKLKMLVCSRLQKNKTKLTNCIFE